MKKQSADTKHANAAAESVCPPLKWAAAACDSLMNRYQPLELPPANRWHYHQGVFLAGMLEVWKETGDDRYVEYVREYADGLIDPHGNLYMRRDELDAIQAGLLLLELDERYGAEDGRYRIAAAKLRGLFDTLNRTSEGGFWHKDKYPYQMWLDGLYMGGVFAVRYGMRYGEPGLADMAVRQERLMRSHMKDERTGLYFHAWDEKRQMPWADPATGCSPELWGRSLGWYGLALTDFLEALPDDHPSREELSRVLGEFVHALVRFQHRESGLWFQVVDRGDRPDNWLETSCSSLFVCAMARAVRFGCAGAPVWEAALAGYEGLLRILKADEHGLVVPAICIGTSAGDYGHYVSRPAVDNDLHGVGAFVLACSAVHDAMKP